MHSMEQEPSTDLVKRTAVLCGELTLRARVEAKVLLGPVAVAQGREDGG